MLTPRNVTAVGLSVVLVFGPGNFNLLDISGGRAYAQPPGVNPPRTTSSYSEVVTALNALDERLHRDGSDEDGDGLKCSIERIIGTLCDKDDSDFDGLRDDVEIASNMDPRNPDSNYDGVPDRFEVDVTAMTASLAAFTDVSRDTDGDGIDDAWDYDNDNDGVSDSLDLSPQEKTAARSQFDFVINTSGEDRPLYINFQFRPADPEHVKLFGQYWDWPHDEEGTMQDRDGSADDLQIIPYLHLTLSGPEPDRAELQDYGVVLANSCLGGENPGRACGSNDHCNGGTCIWNGDAYVAVSPVLEHGEKVAFTARMIYPSGTDSSQLELSARLVWRVVGNTDQPDSNDGADYERTPVLLATYEEDIALTGFSVTEYCGSDVGLVYGADLDQMVAANFLLPFEFVRNPSRQLGDMSTVLQDFGVTFDHEPGGFGHPDEAMRALYDVMVEGALDQLPPDRKLPVVAIYEDCSKGYNGVPAPASSLSVDLPLVSKQTARSSTTRWYDSSTRTALTTGEALKEIAGLGLPEGTYDLMGLALFWATGEQSVFVQGAPAEQDPQIEQARSLAGQIATLGPEVVIDALSFYDSYEPHMALDNEGFTSKIMGSIQAGLGVTDFAVELTFKLGSMANFRYDAYSKISTKIGNVLTVVGYGLSFGFALGNFLDAKADSDLSAFEMAHYEASFGGEMISLGIQIAVQVGVWVLTSVIFTIPFVGAIVGAIMAVLSIFLGGWLSDAFSPEVTVRTKPKLYAVKSCVGGWLNGSDCTEDPPGVLAAMCAVSGGECRPVDSVNPNDANTNGLTVGDWIEYEGRLRVRTTSTRHYGGRWWMLDSSSRHSEFLPYHVIASPPGSGSSVEYWAKPGFDTPRGLIPIPPRSSWETYGPEAVVPTRTCGGPWAFCPGGYCDTDAGVCVCTSPEQCPGTYFVKGQEYKTGGRISPGVAMPNFPLLLGIDSYSDLWYAWKKWDWCCVHWDHYLEHEAKMSKGETHAVGYFDILPDNISAFARWGVRGVRALDSDRDGLSNRCEIDPEADACPNLHESDPWRADTDGDGLVDNYEWMVGTDPNLQDTDGDGLLDWFEVQFAMDPLVSDMDGDGLGDYQEIAGWDVAFTYGPAECDNGECCWADYCSGYSCSSNDECVRRVEMRVYSDPRNPDSDGDGLNDEMEYLSKLNPRSRDTNGDGVDDVPDPECAYIEHNPDFTLDIHIGVDEAKFESMDVGADGNLLVLTGSRLVDPPEVELRKYALDGSSVWAVPIPDIGELLALQAYGETDVNCLPYYEYCGQVAMLFRGGVGLWRYDIHPQCNCCQWEELDGWSFHPQYAYDGSFDSQLNMYAEGYSPESPEMETALLIRGPSGDQIASLPLPCWPVRGIAGTLQFAPLLHQRLCDASRVIAGGKRALGGFGRSQPTPDSGQVYVVCQVDSGRAASVEVLSFDGQVCSPDPPCWTGPLTTDPCWSAICNANIPEPADCPPFSFGDSWQYEGQFVSVDDDGYVYVADVGNKRLVLSDKYKTFRHEVAFPDEPFDAYDYEIEAGPTGFVYLARMYSTDPPAEVSRARFDQFYKVVGSPGAAATHDLDGDGLPRDFEDRGWTVTFTDEDCIACAVTVTSNPILKDTDLDGLSDDEEYYGIDGRDPADPEDTGDSTNPRDADTDHDGLIDSVEAGLCIPTHDRKGLCNPTHFDTDGDGLADGVEVAFGSDPAEEDTDADGLTDLQEFGIESNPTNPDTDGDGLGDYEEYQIALANGRDPQDLVLSADSDGDFMFDGREDELGTDLLLGDTDGDGLLDGVEGLYGADPKNSDSDGDGAPDGSEVALYMDADNPDMDGDGLLDGEELDKGLNPRNSDSDLDGIPDSLDKDSDADHVQKLVLLYDEGDGADVFKERIERHVAIVETPATVDELLAQYAEEPYIVLVGQPDGDDPVGTFIHDLLEDTGDVLDELMEPDSSGFAVRHGIWTPTQTVVMLPRFDSASPLHVLDELRRKTVSIMPDRAEVTFEMSIEQITHDDDNPPADVSPVETTGIHSSWASTFPADEPYVGGPTAMSSLYGGLAMLAVQAVDSGLARRALAVLGVNLAEPEPNSYVFEAEEIDTIKQTDASVLGSMAGDIKPSVEINRYNEATTPAPLDPASGLEPLDLALGRYVDVTVTENVPIASSDILKRAHIRVYYKESELDRTGNGIVGDPDDIDETKMSLYYHDEATGAWTKLSLDMDDVFDLGVNTEDVELYGESYAGYVFASVGHLSLFGVAGQKFNEPPDVSEAYADPDTLRPPNHKLVDVVVRGVTDPDGDEVTITVTGVTSDEPDDSSQGSRYTPDAIGLGSDVVSLRAERQGPGNGRIYAITFVASDGRGGETEGTVTVCVPHDQNNDGGNCVDDGQLYDVGTLRDDR